MQGESYDEDVRDPLGQHDDCDEGVALGGSFWITLSPKGFFK